MYDQLKTPPDNGTASLPLLADSAALLKVRIRPSEFARLMGVSKQAISCWIRDGKISINPIDGRLDVQAAIQQVLKNTDPGRLRARVLRQAVEDVQGLRNAAAEAETRAESLERERDILRQRLQLVEGDAEHTDRLLVWLVEGIKARESELRATPDSQAWAALLTQIEQDAAANALGEGEGEGDDMIPTAAELAAVMAPEGWQPVGD